MTNKEIAEAFADRFDPPLNVVGTQNINGVPAKDGWMCAYFDKAQNIGVTFVVRGDGQYQAYLEAVGNGSELVEYTADTMIVVLDHFARAFEK